MIDFFTSDVWRILDNNLHEKYKEKELEIINLKPDIKKEWDFYIKKIQSSPTGSKTIHLHHKKTQQLIAEIDRLNHIHDNLGCFLNENCIIYLVAKFENFIKNCMRLAYSKKPEMLLSSDKNIKIKELGTAKDFETIQQKMIEKEVESIDHGGIEKIVDYLELHKLHLQKTTNWKSFEEIFYRRNILVHNNGIPNEIYRTKTSKKSKKKIFVSDAYVKNSKLLFEKYSHLITNHFENKFTPKSIFSHSNPVFLTSKGIT